MNFDEFKDQYQKVPVEEYPNQVPKNPIVSVCVQTYQHASYIRECLDSILMQVTDFPFEILLGEDASTDGTREICIEYAEKHPDKIRLFLHHRENNIKILGSPTGRFNSLTNFFSARGKYIAICEGDDYWTDPEKLQKQYLFMESNSDCSLCFHASKTIRNNDPDNFSIERHYYNPGSNRFGIKDIVSGGGGFMATNSMMFPQEYVAEVPNWIIRASVLDFPLMLILANSGNIGYIDEVMSAYRHLSSNEAWTYSLTKRKTRKKFQKSLYILLSDFDEWTQYEHHKYLSKNIDQLKHRHFKANIKSTLFRITSPFRRAGKKS